MDLGSEISRKFKDSIKQKLKECGTYIDDELPEYIMVMIANKRQENQMKEDLSLFLGEETDYFVEWLFQMLTNLQNVAQDKLKTDQSTLLVGDAKEAQNVQKGKELVQKEVENKELKRTSVLIEKKSDLVYEKNEIKDNIGTLDILENENECNVEGKNYTGKKRRRSSEGRKRKLQEVPLEKTSRNAQLSPKEPSKKRKPSFSSTSNKRDDDDTNEKEEETIAPKTIASTVTVQKIRPSLPRSRQPTGSLVMRAINEANLSVAMKPRRSQAQIEVEARSADDTIERKIHLKRGRGNFREQTISYGQERSTDCNEDRETEGIEEIETSSKEKVIGDQEKPQEDDIELEVGENEFIDEGDEHTSNKRIVISHRGIEDDSVDNETGVSYKMDYNEKETLERRDKMDHSGKNQDGRDELEEVRLADDEERNYSNRKRRKHKRERSSHRERRHNSPKFIVTLHGGLDERAKEERQQHQQQQNYRDKDPLFINLNPIGPMAVLESAQNEINKMARQLDLLQGVVPYNGSPMSILSSQGATVVPPRSGVISSITRPVFQETLPLMSMTNGLAQNNFLPQQDRSSSVLQAPLPIAIMQTASGNKENPRPRVQSREIVVPLEIDGNGNDEDEDAAKVSQTENYQDTVLERCRFWPNCKNPSCSYVHPSKTCRMFPNCTFKDKCMFIHPICKFDQRCTNSECPFTHISNLKRDFSNFESKVTRPFATNNVNTPLCKFIPNCNKSNCPFRHPVAKPCRYGSGCKRANCQFHHETKPATGDALKWTNTSNNVQKHISERKFAVTEKDVTEVPVEIKSNVN